MYKMMVFKGNVIPSQVENNSSSQRKGSMTLFSGGVDAFNTLFSHISENPLLVTLWGSDVRLNDSKGWDMVSNHVKSVCSEFHLDSVAIKTNFREFIKEGELDGLVAISGDGWWHGFQHGLGILTHTAPIAFVLGKDIVYIASSFTKEAKNVTCASDPSIDNFVRFGFSKVSHDGYEFDRSMKLNNISNYLKKSGHKIRLHVCWVSKGGDNCCKCEKCLRTIIGLYACGQNPKEYGFDYEDFAQLTEYFKQNRAMIVQGDFTSIRWNPIQRDLRNNYRLKDVEPNLRWLYKANLANFKPYPLYKRIKWKLISMIQRILKECTI